MCSLQPTSYSPMSRGYSMMGVKNHHLFTIAAVVIVLNIWMSTLAFKPYSEEDYSKMQVNTTFAKWLASRSGKAFVWTLWIVVVLVVAWGVAKTRAVKRYLKSM